MKPPGNESDRPAGTAGTVAGLEASEVSKDADSRIAATRPLFIGGVWVDGGTRQRLRQVSEHPAKIISLCAERAERERLRAKAEAEAIRRYMGGSHKPHRPAMTLAEIMDRPRGGAA